MGTLALCWVYRCKHNALLARAEVSEPLLNFRAGPAPGSAGMCTGALNHTDSPEET